MLSATELGSGFKIAMKDLEIRGAGNILGSEQSGHIHTVGYDLYTRLLSAAVEDLRKEQSNEGNSQDISYKQSQQISVDLGIQASIPKEYIEDLTIRLNFYQSLTQIRNIEQLNDFEKELKEAWDYYQIHEDKEISSAFEGNSPPKILFEDATIQGLAMEMEAGTKSVLLSSSEGGTVFGGFGMRGDALMAALAFLNKAWDAEPQAMTRKQTESSHIVIFYRI